ncbi:hypothetical protein [Desulfosoma caldarium]|uniref:hypothetical protein n=1 Tax=Desulfosoma caldarium TaxID=610254 RepID=UPI000F48ECC9|nr:hypothetical protein [Desulfosoma caldarium]
MSSLGNTIEDMAAFFGAVRPKIEDYFVQCHLACYYDDWALEHLNPSVTGNQTLTTKTLSVILEDVATLPLARSASDTSLPLTDGVNLAWASSLDQFRLTTVGPSLGEQTHLSYEDWENLCARFDALDAWLTVKKEGGCG